MYLCKNCKKQVGCFNYIVVILVAYKLERQWLYERYRRQNYFTK